MKKKVPYAKAMPWRMSCLYVRFNNWWNWDGKALMTYVSCPFKYKWRWGNGDYGLDFLLPRRKYDFTVAKNRPYVECRVHSSLNLRIFGRRCDLQGPANVIRLRFRECFIGGDIQATAGRTIAVPLPRRSPLTCQTIFAPEHLPPSRIPPVCYFSYCTWSSLDQ